VLIPGGYASRCRGGEIELLIGYTKAMMINAARPNLELVIEERRRMRFGSMNLKPRPTLPELGFRNLPRDIHTGV
jgi:hypothetical protein